MHYQEDSRTLKDDQQRLMFTNPFTPSRTDANHRSARAHPPPGDRSDDAKTRFTPRSIPTNRFLRWVRIAETTVNHQPKSHRAEARRAGLEPATNGLCERPTYGNGI